MAETEVRLSPDDNKKPEHTSQESREVDPKLTRQRQIRALNILLLILLLSLFVLGFNGVLKYEGGTVRSTFTIYSTQPVPILEMQPPRGETSLVAVVAHGFAGSKEQMTGVGTELAHAGITSYLFDLPGQGSSSVPLQENALSQGNTQQDVNTVAEVVNYVRAHNHATTHPRIILLGYAFGSAVINTYATQHATDNDLIATILISPAKQAITVSSQTKDILMLVGANDTSDALLNSQTLQNSCVVKKKSAIAQECGNPANGSGRRMVILPGLNHLTILNASSTSQEVLRWLNRAAPHQIKTSAVNPGTRLFWLYFGIASIMLAIFPLCTLLVEIFAIKPTPRPLRGWDVIIGDICLIIGIAASITIQYSWQLFGFVKIFLADYISGYVFICALIMALLFLIIRRKLPIAPCSQPFRQILLGGTIAIFLYLTLGQLISFAWEHLTFTAARTWRFGLIFILVLPIFLLDEGLNRGYQEQGRLRGIAASIGFKVLLLGGLFTGLIITPGLAVLSMTWSLPVLLLLILGGFCTQLYISGRAALAGAILSALVIAWCMAVTLPIT